MTTRETIDRLHRLHFESRWTKKQIAREAGLSRPVVSAAFDGTMSRETQVRLEHLFKRSVTVTPDRAMKKKPGMSKRFFIRYKNLAHWIREIEIRTGIRKYTVRDRYITRANGGYLCTKLDFILKTYLLELCGEELRKKKVSLGDCYSVEQWVKRLAALFPERRDLWASLMQRRRHTNAS